MGVRNMWESVCVGGGVWTILNLMQNGHECTCINKCGRCLDQRHCFHVNGSCMNWCDNWYYGDMHNMNV